MQKNNIHNVPIINGCSVILVQKRSLRKVYSTNREIKLWATYFLLKAISTSGHIHHWIKQWEELSHYLQCNEGTFRTRLAELKRLKLLDIIPGHTIRLCSYQKAASVLGIEYNGTTSVTYNQDIKGSNIFSYIICADEIVNNQQAQLNALVKSIDKNPLLYDCIEFQLIQRGCNPLRLRRDSNYFQKELLMLQLISFSEGSPIMDLLLQRRADINRGVNRLALDYGFKSIRSVIYLKRRLIKLGIIEVEKIKVVSPERSRRYIPADGDRRKDGYMYLRSSKETMWQLCDQVIPNNNIFIPKSKRNEEAFRKAA